MSIPPFPDFRVRRSVPRGSLREPKGTSDLARGAFGLLHYLDHRDTKDIDARWQDEATGETREDLLAAIETALRPFGEVKRRSWGDVSSVDLIREGEKVFSFQVARRSARLQEPLPSGWPAVLLDSLADLVASKMVALVERGAPRDFLDIREVCRSGLETAADCWRLWRERQERAESDAGAQRARLAVETHLSRIALHRPLSGIADPAEREEAMAARAWFAKELLDALVD
jgi:hypothetical protein